MKKFSLIAVALFMAIALVACSAVTTDSPAAAEPSARLNKARKLPQRRRRRGRSK